MNNKNTKVLLTCVVIKNDGKRNDQNINNNHDDYNSNNTQ